METNFASCAGSHKGPTKRFLRRAARRGEAGRGGYPSAGRPRVWLLQLAAGLMGTHHTAGTY